MEAKGKRIQQKIENRLTNTHTGTGSPESSVSRPVKTTAVGSLETTTELCVQRNRQALHFLSIGHIGASVYTHW